MKVVFIAPFGIRPKGTVIARMLPLAAEMQRIGHEVIIVVPPYTNPEDSGRVEVINGVTVINVTLGPSSKALSAPFVAWRLFRAMLAERPDLVHLFKPKGYGGLAAMLQIWCSRFGFPMPPLFLDTDDLEGEGGMNDLHAYSAAEKRLYSFQEQWLPRRMQGVTVASRLLEEMILGMGIARERVLYLPNAVEDTPAGDGQRVRGKLGLLPETRVLLLYTRFFEFSQEKLHYLFAGIHRQEPLVRFLVVGKGRVGEEERLVAAARENGFDQALVMAGWLEPSEIADYLAAADVAIYPFADTLVNRAKCPAKLTELMRAGVPVIADRVGQISEYFAPELQHQLCSPGDWDEMVEKCVSLLRDGEKSGQSGVMGRQHLLDRFNWRGFALKLNEFYRERGAIQS